MNKYVIERTIPGAGKLGPKDLADVDALREPDAET